MRMSTRSLRRFGAAVLALALVATACGGAAEGEADGDGAAVRSPAASLDFLGDLPAERGPVVVETLDGSGGELALGDGTVVQAGAGAFGAATEVTAQAFDLDFASSLDDAPWARAYVVSTVDHVELGEPVIIEIQRPAAGLRAVQIIDGELADVPVLGTTTALIEIPHFSEVVTMVLEAFDDQRAQVPEPDHGAADASFFTACFAAVNTILGGSMRPDPMGEADPIDVEYADQMAMSLCTNALIRRASPGGKHVSTECVGDRIAGGVDFREAVGLCAADESEQKEAEDDEGEDDEESAEGPAPVPLIDGTYVGENGYIWVNSGFDVINDVVRVEIQDGAVVDFVFDRDWFKYINMSTNAPDWFEGAQCEYDAWAHWANAGPATRDTVVDEDTGAVSIIYRQPGQLDLAIAFPNCPREFVPVSSQADGTDNVAPLVGWAVIRQDGPNLTVHLESDAGPMTNPVTISPG